MVPLRKNKHTKTAGFTCRFYFLRKSFRFAVCGFPRQTANRAYLPMILRILFQNAAVGMVRQNDQLFGKNFTVPFFIPKKFFAYTASPMFFNSVLGTCFFLRAYRPQLVFRKRNTFSIFCAAYGTAAALPSLCFAGRFFQHLPFSPAVPQSGQENIADSMLCLCIDKPTAAH